MNARIAVGTLVLGAALSACGGNNGAAIVPQASRTAETAQTQGSASALDARVGQNTLALVGSIHEHSAYSDGYPGSTPATFYASGKQHGLAYMIGSDHSDFLALPVSTSGYCLGAALPQCVPADQQQRLASLDKWQATQTQAAAATTSAYTAARGFEWSSERFGHIGVYLSQNYTSAVTDGGNAEMTYFWAWFTQLPAALGGGTDALATFNHPGLKCVSQSDPGCNWNDFAFMPNADQRMVGIEVFGYIDADYGSAGPSPAGYYAHALDKGWHLGAIGAEDLGHAYVDDWGAPQHPKTVILAANNTVSAIHDALLARHFYATRDANERLTFTAGRAMMGDEISVRRGGAVRVDATLADATGKALPGALLELVTTGGRIVLTGTNTMHASVRLGATDKYLFVRARRADRTPIAYSSPIFVTAGARDVNDTEN